jgi:hypothetical protein
LYTVQSCTVRAAVRSCTVRAAVRSCTVRAAVMYESRSRLLVKSSNFLTFLLHSFFFSYPFPLIHPPVPLHPLHCYFFCLLINFLLPSFPLLIPFLLPPFSFLIVVVLPPCPSSFFSFLPYLFIIILLLPFPLQC